MAESTRPKVGLLGLYLEFYEKLCPQLRSDRDNWVHQQVLPALSGIADVNYSGGVFRREDVERTVEKFEHDGMDMILVVLLTYSPSLISAPALKRTRLPILVWNTQELWGIDDSYGDPELDANHGVHGTQDLCNVLTRAGVRFQYFTSHLRDADTLLHLSDHFKVAKAIKRLRSSRVGLLGYPFPGMGDFGLDTTYYATSLGCACEALPLPEYLNRAEKAAPGETAKLVQEYRADYDVPAEATEADLAATARAEIALRGMVRDYRLDACSYQFLSFGDDHRTETLPFIAACRMLADGIGFGGEGDVISAAYSAFMGWLNPMSTFSEIFSIDFAGNTVLLSHMGEANVAMARKDVKPRMTCSSATVVPITGKQMGLVFNFQPGPATLTALTLVGNQRWRIIASPMTLEDTAPLPKIALPQGRAKPAGDIRDFLTGYAYAGGPHHSALCFGDARRQLKIAARYLDADYVEV